MRKQNFKIIFFILTLTLILLFVVNRYKKFLLYTSEEVVLEMNNWWLHIDRYYKSHREIPTTEEFFLFAERDSFIIDNFPELIPNGVDENDFVITTDSVSYFDVWLFSASINRKDTLYFHEIEFKDFLLKRSILLIKAPLSELGN